MSAFCERLWKALIYTFMSNTPNPSSHGHRQDLPATLNNCSPEKTTTGEKREHRGQLTQPSRRVQERGGWLKDPELALDPVLEKLQNEILQLTQHKHRLMEKYKELDREIAEASNRMEKRMIQRADLKEITGELAVSQRFLSTADSLSEAEIIRDMEALNEEIFQLAAIAADKIHLHEQCYLTDEESAKYRERIDHILSPEFMELVVSKKLQDTLAIQMGWQAILTRLCSSIIRKWDFKNSYAGEDIRRMYKHIRSQSKAYYDLKLIHLICSCFFR